MKDGTTTNPIDRDPIDQISLSGLQVSAYGSREEAHGKGLYRGIPEPSNILSDVQGLAHWKECYRDLWQLKIAFEEKHNR